MSGGARDTIFALSSGRGRSAIAVVRMSGPECSRIVLELTIGGLPPPRRAAVRAFRAPGSGALIDRGLLLWFPKPHSATGEDVAEFHIHGGFAVQQALFRALEGYDGVRPAEPGEFSRRAFANGRLDLIQAEGLADLIAAETEAQRRQALGQLEGTLSTLYQKWRRALLHVMADVEAEIDFSDQDLPFALGSQAMARLRDLEEEMGRHLMGGGRGELVREGVRVAIIGAPNAGKSSLLNALMKRDVAIVHDAPGTTRDVVESRLALNGQLVTIMDTAGIRDTDDPVEREGVARAEIAARLADIVLVVLDGSDEGPVSPRIRDLVLDHAMVVINKADLCFHRPPKGFGAIETWVSAKTGEGMGPMIEAVSKSVDALIGAGESVPLTRARHRAGIRDARAAIGRAISQDAVELCAEDLRAASVALGRLVGEIGAEEVLDRVFSEFCVGK